MGFRPARSGRSFDPVKFRRKKFCCQDLSQVTSSSDTDSVAETIARRVAAKRASSSKVTSSLPIHTEVGPYSIQILNRRLFH
jgi:hypothetical protein